MGRGVSDSCSAEVDGCIHSQWHLSMGEKMILGEKMAFLVPEQLNTHILFHPAKQTDFGSYSMPDTLVQMGHELKHKS